MNANDIAIVIDSTRGDFDPKTGKSFLVELGLQRIRELFNGKIFPLMEQWHGEEDPCDGWIEGGISTKEVEIGEIINRMQVYSAFKRNRCMENGTIKGYYGWEQDKTILFTDPSQEVDVFSMTKALSSITDEESLIKVVNENFFDGDELRLVSRQQIEENERNRKRQELEAIASRFLRRNSLQRIDCLEAINQLWLELKTISSREEQHFSGECRAERYMSHRMSGASHAFWENEDWDRAEFSADRNKLESLLEYIQEYFPLLWAEWEAQQGG